MTNLECIAQVDALWDNAATGEQKQAWLDELDRRIDAVLHSRYREVFPPFTVPGGERALLLQSPFDSIYGAYLAWKLHLTQGETERAENARSLYRAAWSSYGDYLCRTYGSTPNSWKWR